jgi:2-oxoglutarate dehydrogenase E1 component
LSETPDTRDPTPDPSAREAELGPNAWLIEEKYQQFREFPESVGEPWKHYLQDLGPGADGGPNGPRTPAAPAPPPPLSPPASTPAAAAAGEEPIRGAGARIVENMERSLAIPTATSARDAPVRLLEENRRILNQVLTERGAGKISFTHLIAWAVLQGLKLHPAMTASFREIDGTPHRVIGEQVNLGLAVDVERKNGTRTLLVPNVKAADRLEFAEFFDAYNAVIEKVRKGTVEPDDFVGTTVTLTNPGMIGTVHSIPRLMEGQGLIVATGAIGYPAEYRSADPRTLASLGLGKIMTVTSTYDHRVIQGAESGAFLLTLDRLLSGENRFYDEIFESLHIPHLPLVQKRDANPFLDRRGLDEKQAKVLELITMYRVRGHLIADLNPLASGAPAHPELDPEHYGLTVWDYDREFVTGGLAGRDRMTLREILEELRSAYCRTIGVEYRHIQEPGQKKWILDRVEGWGRSDWTDAPTKLRILDRLNAAEAFERFLHTKYVGHKRFSLEGAETLIPCLDLLFTRAAEAGIEESVIGMAHRGRLNVLANILGKSLERMFREFEGDLDPESLEGSGDVKYHLGATGKHRAGDVELALTLASNPSHLEAVDPVVEGMARAKQDERRDKVRDSVLPVLIHGDAAFAGQGVVAETLNLSDLMGYRTGGTIHIVVNNGIGFTTSPVDARSTVYPTDVARMVQAPIFHVNGNDPEACVRATELALAFRQEFKKDVVVDLFCYRRHGHNESDEPAFTQPIMYAAIDRMEPVRRLYRDSLVGRGEISLEAAEASRDDFRARLEAGFECTRDSRPPTPILPQERRPEDAAPSVETGVPRETLDRILQVVSNAPDQVHVHPKLVRQLRARAQALAEDAVDWATGEALAFGSLIAEGTPVRLSGQDSRRGTFSHRHAALIDQQTGQAYIPLKHLQPGQASFMVYDSHLAEFAVLGFEYGYSVSRPDALVLWEAQFGDFVNGAQIVIDNFLSSAEEKWNQKSRLVLLLPHGYEGQGPEHSSARLERFLTLCAKKNLRVAMPTTAAQYFHLLRRQVHQSPPKPLVVMAPKSLLRAPTAKSRAKDFVAGKFHLILDDRVRDRDAEKLLLCSGKVAYDLMDFRDKHSVAGHAIIRMEQLYPFPADDLAEILKRYPRASDVKWVQEEPMNMGAWTYVQDRIAESIAEWRSISFAGRPPSGSPAAGSQSMHAVEHEYLIQQAFFT